MKNKKTYKGSLGNFVDSILSDPIKKMKPTEEDATSEDSVNRIVSRQPKKNGLSQKKK